MTEDRRKDSMNLWQHKFTSDYNDYEVMVREKKNPDKTRPFRLFQMLPNQESYSILRISKIAVGPEGPIFLVRLLVVPKEKSVVKINRTTGQS